MTLSSCYWSLWESVHPVNAPSHHPWTSMYPEAFLGLQVKSRFLCRSSVCLVVVPIQRGELALKHGCVHAPVTHPPHIRFSDAVCLVALLPLKLSSAACLSSHPPSPCVGLCMLEAFTSSCVQDSSLVMYPSKAHILPMRGTLRPVLHAWPSVPGFALRSTGL